MLSVGSEREYVDYIKGEIFGYVCHALVDDGNRILHACLQCISYQKTRFTDNQIWMSEIKISKIQLTIIESKIKFTKSQS